LTDIERVRIQVEHALAYLQQGWHLCFMPDGSKGPRTDDWNTPGQLVTTPGQVVAKLQGGPQNMGLCHQPSGTVAIDVDNEQYTRLIFDDIGIDYDDLIGRGLRIKSREGRDKLIFRGPDMPLIKVQWPTPDAVKPTDRMTIVEFRAGPNQDVLPPSMHPDTGKCYEWRPGRAPWDFPGGLPELPLNVLQFWQSLADRNSGTRDDMANLCPWKKAAVGKTFLLRTRKTDAGNQDVIGKFNASNDLGVLLEGAGYKRKGRRYLAPSSSTCIPGVTVLEDRCFSHHGSDPLADGYAHDAFDLLTILYHNGNVVEAIKDAAQQLGIERDAPKVDMKIDMKIDMATLIANIEKRQAAVSKPPVDAETGEILQPRVAASTPVGGLRAPVPDALLHPPGIVGEWVQWVEDNSQYPQRLFAVGAALCMFGTALGRKVMSKTGLRTNLYVVALGSTGSGKEGTRHAVKKTMIAADMTDNLGGEEFASKQGLHNRVAGCPASLFMIDEFGMALKALNGAKTESFKQEVIAKLIKLYGLTRDIVHGEERANQTLNKRVDIEYPCVNLYGTSTAEPFYEALSGADVASGWLNRLLVITAQDDYPEFVDVATGDPPEHIVAFIKAARMMSHGLVGLNGMPIMVPMNGMAEPLFVQFMAEVRSRVMKLNEDPMTSSVSALWARAWEQAVKIALILSVGMKTADDLRNPDCALEIEFRCAEWAIAFVRHFIAAMESEVRGRVGEGELDRANQEALRLIVKAGPKGLTVAELARNCRAFRRLGDKKRQEAMLATLQYHESVKQVEMITTGRPRMAWVSWEYAAALEETAEAT
jgi:hypothetical protein